MTGSKGTKLPAIVAPAADGDDLFQDQVAFGGTLDEAGLDEEDDGGQVQALFEELTKKVQSKAAHKQAKMFQEVKRAIDQQVSQLEATAQKDAKDGKALCAAPLAQLTKQLAAKMQQVEDLSARYQQDLHGLWEDYNSIYALLEDTKAEALKALGKRKAALKRKLDQVQTGAKGRLQEVEQKVAKIAQKQSVLPNLTDALKGYM